MSDQAPTPKTIADAGNRPQPATNPILLSRSDEEKVGSPKKSSDGSHTLPEGINPNDDASAVSVDLGEAALVPAQPTSDTDGPSSLRKHLLLAAFATATFVDICNVSGVRLTVAQIGHELGLPPSKAVWVINTYALCLAAFLLLAGRLADIFRADRLFLGGLVVLGSLTLGVSFIQTDRYTFLALRSLGGIAGAFVIPAAYRLTVGLFPDKTEQKRKLALLSVASGLGGVFGLLLAGAVSWHWFFRIVAIVCYFSCICTFFLLPKNVRRPQQAFEWQRMDLGGALLIIGALTCFNLSLTEGPIREWKGVVVILPLTLAPLLAIAFFCWERLLNDHRAMLPPSVWRIPNAIASSLVILVPFPFWATTQVQYATWYQEVGGWSPIKVALVMLPQGLTSLACGILVQFRPQLFSDARYTIPIAGGCILVAYILLIFSDGGLGMDYWRFCFPAFILGSGGAMMTYFASSVNFISNCPPEMAGVAGAWTQVTTHIAGAVCLAIQSAFNGTEIDSDWAKSGRKGFLFMLGWTVLFCAQYFLPWSRIWRQDVK